MNPFRSSGYSFGNRQRVAKQVLISSREGLFADEHVEHFVDAVSVLIGPSQGDSIRYLEWRVYVGSGPGAVG